MFKKVERGGNMKWAIGFLLMILIVLLTGWYMEGKKYNKKATIKQIYNKSYKEKKKIVNYMLGLVVLCIITLLML